MMNFGQVWDDITSDVKKLFRGSSVLGVDIGASSIKAVELTRRGTTLSLTNYAKLETRAYLDHPNQALQTSSLRIAEKEIIELIKLMIRDMKSQATKTILAIPSFIAFVATFDMPFLSPQETKKTVGFQARQLIPMPIEQITIDWIKAAEWINEKGTKTQRLLLIGTPTDTIKRYTNIFKKLPWNVIQMEMESIAVTRAVTSKRSGVTMIIDIGTLATNIVFTENGQWVFNGQIDYGGVYLTQALARGLGLGAARAEQLKRKRGLLGTGGELELSTLMVPFLDVIIQEVKRAQKVYEVKYKKEVQEAVLVGGGSLLLGIEQYVRDHLGVPLVEAKTFESIQYPETLKPIIGKLSKDFAVAVGLAKRYLA